MVAQLAKLLRALHYQSLRTMTMTDIERINKARLEVSLATLLRTLQYQSRRTIRMMDIERINKARLEA